MKTKKELALDSISTLVCDFLYFDRKHDDELTWLDMQQLIKTGILTEDEIVQEFIKQLREAIKENF